MQDLLQPCIVGLWQTGTGGGLGAPGLLLRLRPAGHHPFTTNIPGILGSSKYRVNPHRSWGKSNGADPNCSLGSYNSRRWDSIAYCVQTRARRARGY